MLRKMTPNDQVKQYRGMCAGRRVSPGIQIF